MRESTEKFGVILICHRIICDLMSSYIHIITLKKFNHIKQRNKKFFEIAISLFETCNSRSSILLKYANFTASFTFSMSNSFIFVQILQAKHIDNSVFSFDARRLSYIYQSQKLQILENMIGCTIKK